MKNTYFMSKKVMNERQFSDLIYKMVNESLDALSGYNFESNDNANDNNAQNDDSKRRNNRRRQQVEAFFKQPGVNPAAYAYRLYRVKPVEGDDTNDMKNARSKFMKCLNHEKNEDGYEYAFDSSEVNTLFSMISGNELKESKISLSESDIMYMVNESVKKLLNELNWKTYRSASKKQPRGFSRSFSSKDNFYDKIDDLTNQKLKKIGKTWKDHDEWRKANDEAEKEIRAKEDKMLNRAWAFNDAAKDNFMKDFGYEDETGKIHAYSTRSDYGEPGFDIEMRDANGNIFGQPKYFVTNQDFYGQNGQHTPGKWCIGTVGWAGAVAASPDFDTEEEARKYGKEKGYLKDIGEPSDNLKSAYDKARKELTGKSHYEKGKGWVSDD